MSQHDYDIANQAGAAFRSDINSVLGAIVSNNSGAAAPATVYANMWWPDTTNTQLKRRNFANTVWELWPTFDANGSAAFGGASLASWATEKAIDLPGSAAISGGTATGSANVSHNAYYNAGWKYKGTGAASLYQTGGGAHYMFVAGSGTAGNAISWTQALSIDGSSVGTFGTTGHRVIVHPDFIDNEGWNGASAGLYVGKVSGTGRSINAPGTINAGGADYAEYMRKAARWWMHQFLKGDLVGINADGELTPKFSEAVAFAVKSTNPSYVGGDVWGVADQVGERPQMPEPKMPPPPEMPAQPDLPRPALPARPLEKSYQDEKLFMQAWSEWKAACAVIVADWEAKYSEQIGPWKAECEAIVAAWLADGEQAHRLAMVDYQADLALFEQRLEAERQKVDRIAFAGQVPVNVLGAQPGDYIVPVEDDEGGIQGVAKAEDDMSLKDYMRAVGKVIAIEADGRARIIVKVA